MHEIMLSLVFGRSFFGHVMFTESLTSGLLILVRYSERSCRLCFAVNCFDGQVIAGPLLLNWPFWQCLVNVEIYAPLASVLALQIFCFYQC